MKREESTKIVKTNINTIVEKEVKEYWFIAEDGTKFSDNGYYYKTIALNQNGIVRSDGTRIHDDKEMELACKLHDERYTAALKAGLRQPLDSGLTALANMMGISSDESIRGIYWAYPNNDKDNESIIAYLVSNFGHPTHFHSLKMSFDEANLVVVVEDNSEDYNPISFRVFSLSAIRDSLSEAKSAIETAEKMLP